MKQIADKLSIYSWHEQMNFLNKRYERMLIQKPINCTMTQFYDQTDMLFNNYPKSLQRNIIHKIAIAQLFNNDINLQQQSFQQKNYNKKAKKWRKFSLNSNDSLVEFLQDKEAKVSNKQVL